MASVSVEQLILFIASIVIAAGVAGVFTSSVDDLAGAIDDQGIEVSDDIRTSVEIISDSGSDAVYDDAEETSGTVTLLVKNTGSSDLVADPSQVDVLLNGQFRTDVSVALADGDGTETSWGQTEVVTVQLTDVALDPGDHRVKLIVNGDEELFQFRVEGET